MSKNADLLEWKVLLLITLATSRNITVTQRSEQQEILHITVDIISESEAYYAITMLKKNPPTICGVETRIRSAYGFKNIAWIHLAEEIGGITSLCVAWKQ